MTTDGHECECPPCPGRGYDGHGMKHCAECCFGTGVEADPDCPTHGAARPADEDGLRAAIKALADLAEAQVPGPLLLCRNIKDRDDQWSTAIRAVLAAHPEARATRDYEVTHSRSGRPSSERDGECTCDYNPETTQGPEEDCPFHGRPYSYWIQRGDALQVRIDNLLAWCWKEDQLSKGESPTTKAVRRAVSVTETPEKENQ